MKDVSSVDLVLANLHTSSQLSLFAIPSCNEGFSFELRGVVPTNLGFGLLDLYVSQAFLTLSRNDWKQYSNLRIRLSRMIGGALIISAALQLFFPQRGRVEAGGTFSPYTGKSDYFRFRGTSPKLPGKVWLPSGYPIKKCFLRPTSFWENMAPPLRNGSSYKLHEMNAQYLKIYLWSFFEPNLLFMVMLQFLRLWQGEGNKFWWGSPWATIPYREV